MEEDYCILNEYVRDSSFESYLTPDVFIAPCQEMSNLETSIGLEIKNIPETALFIVGVIIHCKITLVDGRTLYKLNLRYDSLVAVKHDLSDESIREYLNIAIPQEVYPRIKDAVYVRTKDIGFSPIILDNYSFKDNKAFIGQADGMCS